MASVALALFNARPEMSKQARSRPVGWPTRALAPPAFEAGHSAKDTSLLSMSVSEFFGAAVHHVSPSVVRCYRVG
jgi:hypothetical protein